MLRHVVLICVLPISLSYTAAQTQTNKEGIPIEVVATAFEYVPTTVSHLGHSYTNCQGNTDYFATFNSYGNSGSISGTATTNTQCTGTFSPPTEDTTYKRVNYTIAKSEHALYLLSCTQRTESKGERFSEGGALVPGLIGAFARSKCPAFSIGSTYTLSIRNTSDARLVDAAGGKPGKLDFLSSAALPVSTTQTAPPLQANAVPLLGEAKVHFTSSPSGSEIYVDGKFAGTTPSDIGVTAGEHVVRITSRGKEWSRTIQITSGEISLHAELVASSTEEGTGQVGSGQEIEAKDSAVNQMRRIVDAIRQCPQETGPFLDVSILHRQSPRILEWDVLPSDSLRAPFQGYVRFDTPIDLQETVEAKRSKELHKKYEYLTIFPFHPVEYRYEFDLGSDGPELRGAVINLHTNSSPDFKPYEPSPNSEGTIFCWDKIARSPGSLVKDNAKLP
jgi:PEGA domain